MSGSSGPFDPALIPRDLRWRCRRGMRELDVLLVRWLESCWAGASPQARQGFRDLLECEDDQLWDWLLGRSLPEQPALRDIVHEIRAVPAVSQ